MLEVAGWCGNTIAAGYEMPYQSDSGCLCESAKFTRSFQFEQTAYRDAARIHGNQIKEPRASVGQALGTPPEHQRRCS